MVFCSGCRLMHLMYGLVESVLHLEFTIFINTRQKLMCFFLWLTFLHYFFCLLRGIYEFWSIMWTVTENRFVKTL